MLNLLLIIFAYVLGSVPVGLVLVQWVTGRDIRDYGSGNIGTINVFRAGGLWLALLVFTGDMAKGAVPLLIAENMADNPYLITAVAIAAIVGHNWSVFLRFDGGKGVATTFGTALAIHPMAAGLAGLVWLLTFLLTRYASVSSMAAGLSLPVFFFLSQQPRAQQLYAVIAFLLILWCHRENINRLRQGEELRTLPSDRTPNGNARSPD